MSRTLKALLALAALALLLPALAQAASPTLDGQTLAGSGGTHDLENGGPNPTCDVGTGAGTITFKDLDGLSGSPYIGTFVESGKIHFDGHGNYTLLEADVTITSGLGTVTIHKTGVPGPNGSGFCNFGGYSAGPALPGSIKYTATLPDGTTDSGTSTFHAAGAGAVGGSTPVNTDLEELLTSTAHPTTTTVDCSPDTVVAGESTTCTATVRDTAASGATTPTGNVAFASNGPGSFASASCTLQETSTGVASCDVTYTPNATSATPVRTDAITASYPGDASHTGSSGTTTVQVLSIARVARGSFVIGDQNAAVGSNVTFWGAQWWKLNSLSGGRAPSAFKGFAGQTTSNPPACGDDWTTGPGNSSDPPATVPTLMAVIASSRIDKSGSAISGDTDRVVVVRTNPGYRPDPGHAGTGTVVAEVCQS